MYIVESDIFMINTDKFILQDKFGFTFDAEFVMKFKLDEIEYIVYNILKDDKYTDVYVGRVLYDNNGNETIISIDNPSEEEKISVPINILESYLTPNKFNSVGNKSNDEVYLETWVVSISGLYITKLFLYKSKLAFFIQSTYDEISLFERPYG